MLHQVLRCAIAPSTRSIATRAVKSRARCSTIRGFHQTCARAQDPSQLLTEWQDELRKANQKLHDAARQADGAEERSVSAAEAEHAGAAALNSSSDTAPKLLQEQVPTFPIEDWVTDFMHVPHTIYTSMHSILPLWAISIPLTTVLLRSTVTLVVWIATRRDVQRLQSIRAFSMAHAFAKKNAKQQDVRQIGVNHSKINGQQIFVPRSALLNGWYSNIKMKYRASSFRVFRRKLIHVPIWLVTIEALRSMAGTRYGLFGLVARSLGWSASESSIMVPAWVEPSMATEGLLWFADLTAPDPYGILSFTLGAVLARSIFKSTAPLRTAEALAGRGRIYGTAVMLAPALGLLAIPMTIEFPAALLLYWTTSTVCAPIVQEALNKRDTEDRLCSTQVKPLTSGLDSLSPPGWVLDAPREGRATRLSRR